MSANSEQQGQFASPPTDDSGEVDLTLIEANLCLTVDERFERHYQARRFAELMRLAGEQFYGSILQILKRLKDHGVEFVLIGGMAAVAYGTGLVTTDIDVSASLDDASLGKIIEVLKGLNPRWRDRPQQFIPIDSVERFRGCYTDRGNFPRQASRVWI